MTAIIIITAANNFQLTAPLVDMCHAAAAAAATSGVAVALDVLDVQRDVEEGRLVALDHRGRLERGAAVHRVHEGPVPRPGRLRLAPSRPPASATAAGQPDQVAVPGNRDAGARETRPPNSAEAAADVALLETPVPPQFAHLLAGRGSELGQLLRRLVWKRWLKLEHDDKSLGI